MYYYWIRIDGNSYLQREIYQFGPCDWNQLQQLVQQGQLTHQTYVWKQGMTQWQMAGEVMELAPLFQGCAPQMPPMPGM